MLGAPFETYRNMLDAAAFAARKHQQHLRKDGLTPYVSHPFRVCLTICHAFGIKDRNVLMAALLHDTIEDTTTDFDDIAENFGPEVAEWVGLLSKDKRLVEGDREKAYIGQLTSAPWQVKVCKLGDIHDNLMDCPNMPKEKRHKLLKNARRYLDALNTDLPSEAKAAYDLVNQLLAEVESEVQNSS